MDVIKWFDENPQHKFGIEEVMAGRCGCGCGGRRPSLQSMIQSEEESYLKELETKLPKWQKIIAKKFKSWDDVTGHAVADLHQTAGVPAEVVEGHFDRVMTGQILDDYLAAWRKHRKVSGI